MVWTGRTGRTGADGVDGGGQGQTAPDGAGRGRTGAHGVTFSKNAKFLRTSPGRTGKSALLTGKSVLLDGVQGPCFTKTHMTLSSNIV